MFERSFAVDEKKRDTRSRVRQMITVFTSLLYSVVCRSLFERHKLMFAFYLAFSLNSKTVSPEELRYLLTGIMEKEADQIENPSPEQIDEKSWAAITNLSSFESLFLLPAMVKENPQAWKDFIENSDAPVPQLSAEQPISEFAQILVTKALKPEKTVAAIEQFVVKTLGDEYTTPPIFSLEDSYDDSSFAVPLLFILTPGNDPVSRVRADPLGRACQVHGGARQVPEFALARQGPGQEGRGADSREQQNRQLGAAAELSPRRQLAPRAQAAGRGARATSSRGGAACAPRFPSVANLDADARLPRLDSAGNKGGAKRFTI